MVVILEVAVRRLALLLALASTTATAHAATFTRDSLDPTVLDVTGNIERGDLDLFNHAVASASTSGHRISAVEIRSSGGLITEAIKIADVIHWSGIATKTVKDHDCASACVLILSAGQSVTIAPGSRVGVHQARLPNGDVSWEQTYVMAAYLTRQGVDHESITHMIDKSGGSVDWLTEAEMHASGWRTGGTSVSASAPPAAPSPSSPAPQTTAAHTKPRQATAAEAVMVDFSDPNYLLRRLKRAN